MNDDFGNWEDFRPPRNFALLAAVFEGGIVVVAVGLGRLLDTDPLDSFPRTRQAIGWGVGSGTAATLPMLVVLWLCLKCPRRPFVELARVIDEVLVPMFRNCRVSELAVISVLAGVGEEMLFRGIIQRLVETWIEGQLGTWISLATAAVLFGLAHRVTATYAMLAGLIGLYLGGIWIVTENLFAERNLLVPITAHAVYDFIVLVFLLKVRKPLAAPQKHE